MIKKGLLVIFMIITLIGVSGCMSKQKSNEPSVKEQVEKYMKDKYNEEFKVVGGGTEAWNAPYQEIYVTTPKFPNAEIMIRRDKKSGEMIDNYMDYLMKSKIEDVMNKIVSQVYPKSKVFYNTEGAPIAGATPQMSVDEYIKVCTLSLIICISDSEYKINKDQKVELLRKKFEEKQFVPSMTMYYLVNGKIDMINTNNWRDLLNGTSQKEWWTLRGDFDMDKSYRYIFNEWREVK